MYVLSEGGRCGPNMRCVVVEDGIAGLKITSENSPTYFPCLKKAIEIFDRDMNNYWCYVYKMPEKKCLGAYYNGKLHEKILSPYE